MNDLVSRMTLEEKVSQMGSEAPAIERLGIPQYNWWNEALHGVARAGIATVFPQVIGLASTWNTDLIYRMAEVISDEGRAKHHEAVRNGVRDLYTGLTFFCPNINIFRDPRWGRGQETYGEDPYLTSRLAVNFIQGLQGDDPHYLKTVATPKHFAVHSGPENKRHSFDAVVSQRDLRMTYLPAFEACIVEGKAYSIMGAYNRVNGEACCASPTLLQKILRDEWGFDGYVVSDCGAIDDIYSNHMPGQVRCRGRRPGRQERLRPGMRLHVRHPLRLRASQRGGRTRPVDRRRSEPFGQAAVHGPLPPGDVRSRRSGALRPDPLQRGRFSGAPRAGAGSGPPIAGPAQEPGQPAAAG